MSKAIFTKTKITVNIESKKDQFNQVLSDPSGFAEFWGGVVLYGS